MIDMTEEFETIMARFEKVTIFPNPEGNWQSECIRLLFEHYREDLTYSVRKAGKGDLVLGPFLNGRERGYTASFSGKEISFAEDRNSDSIVLYSFAWNVGSEAVQERNYRSKSKYLKREHFHEAFNAVLAHLGVEL